METYTHLRPRSLQFEQDGCLPAFDMGRSLRSHLTLWTKGGEHGRTGREGGENKKDDREERKRKDDKIGRNGSERGGRRGERTLTSSFCKHHKRRTVRGSSLGWSPFGDDERWTRRSPLREKRKYV